MLEMIIDSRPTGAGPKLTPSATWWRGAVVYQVYLRSFADGNGDGLGDLAGLRSRLPYLVDLGVDAIWINPWYPSPMVDAGYDVSDYRSVDPRFGSLADAEALLAEAHQAGLRVLLDIVPNHTSDQHLWFQAALAAGPGSPERERYLFRPGRGHGGEEPPNDWASVATSPAWTRVTEPDGRPGEWYCTCSPPSSPTWTGPTRRCGPTSRRRWGSGSTVGWTASASTWPTRWPSRRACPTWPAGRAATRPGTGTRSTRSTGSGGRSPTPTPSRRSSWPRPGSTSRSSSPATCGPTSCTPPSTSSS
jgi:Alpha amylase, catalytic domain